MPSFLRPSLGSYYIICFLSIKIYCRKLVCSDILKAKNSKSLNH
jgi:hypothetical protein